MVRDEAGRVLPMSLYAAKRLANEIEETLLADFFPLGTVLVPAPGSSLPMKGSLRVPLNISRALVENGLGSDVADILERTIAIDKSAYAAPGQRPKALKHYQTISVKQLSLRLIDRIVIVDDFITMGATLLGAASRLAEVFSKADISGFAMIRTISNPWEFNAIVAPCVGSIKLRGVDTRRDP